MTTQQAKDKAGPVTVTVGCMFNISLWVFRLLSFYKYLIISDARTTVRLSFCIVFQLYKHTKLSFQIYPNSLSHCYRSHASYMRVFWSHDLLSQRTNPCVFKLSSRNRAHASLRFTQHIGESICCHLHCAATIKKYFLL